MAKARTSKKEVRYVIRGDDSGHKYFIPVGQENVFQEWVQWEEESRDGIYSGPDFSDNMIDGRFTFTDPKCE